MINEDSRIVRSNERLNFETRQAEWTTECVYCHQPVGGEHAKGCVCRTRTVMVEMTVRYAITVPEDWTPQQIEFHRNEGSWCTDNAIAELESIGGCLCPFTTFAYAGEATAEDVERQTPQPETDPATN